MGREALESSSAVLQTAATPSQLPALSGTAQKKPDVADTGLSCAAFASVSQVERIKPRIGVTAEEQLFDLSC